jgi:hypothetical protein
MTSFSRSSNVIPLRRTSATSNPPNQKYEKRVAERRRRNRRVPGSDEGQGVGERELADRRSSQRRRINQEHDNSW